VTDGRAIVLGSGDQLRADHQIGFAGLEDLDGAAVEIRVAQVDLVAEDERATRQQDALLQGLAVVRLTDADDPDLAVGSVAVLVGELLADLDGAIT
jgi:hypothetical protein